MPLPSPPAHRRRTAVGGGRIGALDGLRGAAAAIVVVHHLLLASVPTLAATYQGTAPRHGTLAWWLSATPLHLVWAGPEAVVVFFVLSGLVLSLPAADQGLGWFRPGYWPRRLVRLYLPVWGALALAWVERSLVARRAVPGASWWLNAQAPPGSAHTLATQATLTTSGTWDWDPVLWSLHWEVIWSLVLPVAVLVALSTRRRPALAAAVGCAAVALSGWGRAVGDARAEYLPMFVVGSLLALHHAALTRRVAAWRLAVAAPLGVVAAAGLTAAYWSPPPSVRTPTAINDWAGIAEALVVASAAVVVALAAGRPGWQRLLTAPPVRLAGSRSYSLYLVHEPLLVTMAFALGGRPSPLLLAAVGLPLVVLATELLWRAVERPATLASRWVGTTVDRSLTSRTGRAAAGHPAVPARPRTPSR